MTSAQHTINADNASSSCPLPGDVNRDGVIDRNDAASIQAAIGINYAFGKLSVTDNTIGWCGYVFNEEISGGGNYKVRFRDYIVDWGRWCERDPLTFIDGANLLQIVSGNVTSVVDPFGTCGSCQQQNQPVYGPQSPSSEPPPNSACSNTRCCTDDDYYAMGRLYCALTDLQRELDALLARMRDPLNAPVCLDESPAIAASMRMSVDEQLEKLKSDFNDLGCNNRPGGIEQACKGVREGDQWRWIMDHQGCPSDGFELNFTPLAFESCFARLTASGIGECSNAARRLSAARELGETGENATARCSGLVKNTSRIDSLTRTAKYRVFDFLDDALQILAESKNCAVVNLSNQLRDFAQWAFEHSYTFKLYIREGARISGPVQELANQGLVEICRITM